MKNIRWIFISLLGHFLLVFLVLYTGTDSSTPYSDNLVDLTVNTPAGGPLGSPTLRKHTPKETRPRAASEIPAVSDAKNEASGIGDEGSVSGSIAGEGPVAWGEVTRFPKVAREIKALYPAEAKKAGIEGPVVLEILIDPSGKVRDVKVISGPGYGLNESAVEAIKKFEFQPAQKGNEPVTVKLRYTYRFKLDVN